MKVHYAILKSKHCSSDRMSSGYKSGEDVYKEIGYNLDDLARRMRTHAQDRRIMVWTPPLPNGIAMCQSGRVNQPLNRRRGIRHE